MICIGSKIKGKWNEKEYLVLKKIGQGGLGHIYKVRDEFDNILAIKISKDMTTITREYDTIKKLQNIAYISKVYDIDDYIYNNEKYFFFVMDYIDGYNLKQIIKNKKIDIYNILGIAIIILDTLNKIYLSGYIYCDIKLENILLDYKNNKIMLIDFGGVIEKGQNIREYTPVYNIDSWGIKGNKAVNYHENITFSIAMIVVSLIFRKEFNPLTNNIEDVVYKIRNLKINKCIKQIIINGLKASYNNIEHFKKDLRNIIYNIKDDNCKNDKMSKVVDFIFGFSVFSFIVFTLYIVKMKFT